MDLVDALRGRNWKIALLDRLKDECADAPFADAFVEQYAVGIHLAVFLEPYLTFLLCGQKTVESRFSINRHPPFEQVGAGDILVLKKSSGPVCGICRIKNAWFYRLNPNTWREIESFATALCMDNSEFWQKKRGASFATLMQVDNVRRITEFDIEKDDPRSWVIIRQGSPNGQGVLL